MALPKKRKRLDENNVVSNRKSDKHPLSEHDTSSAGSAGYPKGSSSRNDQVIKAFEIVEHIEQVHGNIAEDDRKPTSASSQCQADPQAPMDQKDVKLSVSLSSFPESGTKTLLTSGQNNNSIPVIEVKFKIPSFLWKTPILRGITEIILTRFSKA